MTTTTPASTTHIEADPTLPLIRMTRDFAATPAQLVRAHTDPELFVRWVACDDLSTEVLSWDARDGGSYRYVNRRDGAEGPEEYYFRGCFHEISERRLVQTFTFEAFPDGVSLEQMTLEVLGDGRTRLHSTSLVDSFEARDAMLASGMENGVDEGYAALDRLLAAGEV